MSQQARATAAEIDDAPSFAASDIFSAAPFGTFAPRGAASYLISAARHTFLGRGQARRSLWPLMKRQSQRCYDVMVRGSRMRLFPHDNTLERKLILRPDSFCTEEIAFLQRALAEGGTFIDIGANVGALTLPVAKLPNVKAIAVEPGPLALKRLRFNLQANDYGNVIVAPVAISNKDGEVEFTSDEQDIKFSGINARWARGRSITVPTKTLAGLAGEHGFEKIDALKIDVEGHEDSILFPFFATSPRSLWPRRMIIEAIDREGLPDCIAHMRKLGYQDVFKTRANIGLALHA